MDSPGIAPESLACGASVFLLDHEPEGGRRETRTPKASTARPLSRRLPSRAPTRSVGPACPSVQRAAVAGIEPAKGRLTGACLYQHRLHRNEESGWLDLNQRSPASEA